VYWQVISRTNQEARKLADGHYNRKSIGHREWLPGCTEYVALLGNDAASLWACCYQKYRRDGLDCFDNTYFRHITEVKNESGIVVAVNNMNATDLIKEALGITLNLAVSRPRDGIITFIDPQSVRPTYVRNMPTWGMTYVKAGFSFHGVTGTGKLRFQFLPPRLYLPAKVG
jgi:hypothetical protein